MSVAVKTRDSSVLEEFEIPEHLGEVVDDLKKEQQTIQKQLEEVKAIPVARQQDESTKIFNLRQHQMMLKITELEEKKKTTEKELATILQQKNSRLHDDLKKIAQYLLQETRKVDTKISSVLSLKNELQQVFESNLSDRKKNMSLIEEQNIHIHQLGDLITSTSKLLQSDFHFLTKDIERLQNEKQDETKKLTELKVEVARHEILNNEIDAKKIELKEIEQKIILAEKNALAFSKLEEELVVMRAELQKSHDEKERLHESTVRLHQEEFHGQESLARLKLREKHLEHVLSGKKDQLQSLETDILDVRKRLELTKNEEHEVHSKYLHHRDQFNILQNEISRMEGSRASYETMVDDSKRMFEEKREFFTRELETLEKLHEAKNAEFLARQEVQKSRWEEEFRVYSEARKDELKRELESIDKQDLEDIRKKKTELLGQVSQVISSVMSAEGFTSTEEKTKKAKVEVEKAFQLVFGKTRRWKFW